MRQFIEKIPWLVIVLLCIAPGLAPYTPQPHIVEKLLMLQQAALTKPIDIFDLVLHGLPFVLLVAKLFTVSSSRANK